MSPATDIIISKNENPNYNDRSYKIRITLTGRVIAQNVKHIKRTFIPDWVFKQQTVKNIDTVMAKCKKKIEKPDSDPHTQTQPMTKDSNIDLHSIPKGLSLVIRLIARFK